MKAADAFIGLAARVYAHATTWGRYKTGLTELRERNGGTLISVIRKPHRKEISMARKTRRSKRTIVGAAKSGAARVQKIAIKAATAAATAAAEAAVEEVMKSMHREGQARGQTMAAERPVRRTKRKQARKTSQRKRR